MKRNSLKVAMTKHQQLKYNDLILNLTNDFLKQTKARYFNDEVILSSNKKLYKVFGVPIKKALTKNQLYFYLTGLLNKQLTKVQFKNFLNILKNIKLITEF